MSDIVVDSSVVAKWILPESDSAKSELLITRASAAGDRLIGLDLVFPEVANAIWKQRRQLISPADAEDFLEKLRQIPLHVEPAIPLLAAGFSIAVKYYRAIYDALFGALAKERGLQGVTADEPLFNAVKKDCPGIVLLRDL